MTVLSAVCGWQNRLETVLRVPADKVVARVAKAGQGTAYRCLETLEPRVVQMAPPFWS